MNADSDLRQRLGSIEELLRTVDAAADPSLRAAVRELIETVMSLHGAALERVLEILRAGAGAHEAALRKLAADDLVSGILVLHNIHPLDMEARVRRALDNLPQHAGEVELLAVGDGVVRLRLHVKAQGCGSGARSLRETVEEAVYAAAPDLATLTIEGGDEMPGFVPMEMLLSRQLVAPGKGVL